jgi:hypothetical protein
MLRRSALPVVVLALLASVVPASLAQAAPEWVAAANFPLPASDDSIGGTQAPTQVLYQDGGTATEAFLQVVSYPSPLQTALHIGTVAPGGAFSEQLTVPTTAAGIPSEVTLAVAPDGAAVAAWAELAGTNLTTSPVRYLAAYRPAGASTWEAPTTIFNETEAEREANLSDYLTPAIGANGTAAVGIQHYALGQSTGPYGRPNYRIDVAIHPASGSWQALTQISPVGKSANSLSLGFDSEGDLTAFFSLRYVESTSESGDLYTAISRRRGAAAVMWGPEENINTPEIPWSVYSLRLGENEAGDAVVAYQYAQSGTIETRAVTRQGADGAWTTPAQLNAASSAPSAVGVSPDGKAYVLLNYQGTSSGEDCAQAVRAPVGGAFTETRCISPTNDEASEGSLAFLGNEAFFAWRGEVPGESANTSIQAARWGDANALPDATVNLDTPGLDYGAPTLVPDEQGSVVAFYAGPAKQLRAAAYDGAPPILLASGVPATAIAGQPVSFSAAFFDLWSGLGAGQPTWTFGDGSGPVAGAAVTHTYASPGNYTIALAATDALGNATSDTYVITVSPAVPAARDTRPPTVTLALPKCSKKLSKKACKRLRATPGAWRTLTGSVADPAPSSGIASVQVAVYLTHGKRVDGLLGKRFRKTTKARARETFALAKVSGTRWSLRLPKLSPGTYTILVRATDRAGNVSATISLSVRLS